MSDKINDDYIINPLTKRKIKKYGVLYSKLVNRGVIKDKILETYRNRIKSTPKTFNLDHKIAELKDDNH
jgi:hypothetical protein